MPTIALTELTTATLDGTGIFDVLMRANKAHLQAEFDKNRLKGPEYATVYLGALQSVMQTSLAFLTQSRRIDLEAQLLEKQILLADASLTKTTAEIALVEAQTALTVQQRLNVIDDLVTNTAQRGKLAAEVVLLAQKNTTEMAQVMDIGVPTSVIGRQKAVYAGQAEGYTRDAEQKAAQIMVQTWNTRMLSDSAATNYDGVNKLADSYVGAAVQQMLNGIGA